MIKQFKKHSLFIIGLIIFMFVFSRYFIFISNVEVLENGYNLGINYVSLIVNVILIILSGLFIHYLPLLCILSYNPEFPIYIKIKTNYLNDVLEVVANYFVKDITKLNNVIRC